MSRARAVAFVFAIMCISACSSTAVDDQTSAAPQALQTTDGVAIVAVHDGGRGYQAFAENAGRRTALEDGTFRLTNGGEIRVQGGRIVWDAKGAIERMQRNGLTLASDPIG